jgi:hypothetical protein
LVGQRRIRKSITEYQRSRGQCGTDNLFDMLRTRCHHEKRFRQGSQPFIPPIQQDSSDLFPDSGAARFPCHEHRPT